MAGIRRSCQEVGDVRTTLVGVAMALLVAAGARAQTIEGKRIVGGHGYAMGSTYTLRQRIAEMQHVQQHQKGDRKSVTDDQFDDRAAPAAGMTERTGD